MWNDGVAIKEQVELAPGIYRKELFAPELVAQAKPGQFVNLYCRDKSRLMPRPISICDAIVETGRLVLIYAVVGKGTEELSAMGEGDTIRVMGPLGNGFPLEAATEAKEIFLVGGGLGMPPMLFLAKALSDKPLKIFLGFRSQPWMGQEFEPWGEVMGSSDDGTYGCKGTVIDAMNLYLQHADSAARRVLYACGPIPMMRAIQQWQQGQNLETWFSLEERMGCGFGACAGCPAKLRMPDGSVIQKGVCKLGPVFPGEDVIFS